MPSIAVLKTLLSVLLLSVMVATPSFAEDNPTVYRFGDWTLIAPATVNLDLLTAEAPVLKLPVDGMEFLAYWQDGRQRALRWQFKDGETPEDLAVLKSFGRSNLLKGCAFGPPQRIPALKKVRPKGVDALEFPEAGALTIAGSERGLRRMADELVADLGHARIKIRADSPVVRLGEWDSADFCRFELVPATEKERGEFQF